MAPGFVYTMDNDPIQWRSSIGVNAGNEKGIQEDSLQTAPPLENFTDQLR